MGWVDDRLRRFRSVTVERIGLVVGGLACLTVTPWFALAYFPAYGRFDESPPPWADWADWPNLISGDPVDVYNRFGIIFGIGLLVVAGSLGLLARRSTVEGRGVRRAWMVVSGGFGAVAVGSLLEYGFGEFIDPSLGFFIELLGFVAMTIGTVLLGWLLRRESGLGIVASLAVGVSGLVAIAIGVVLVGHIPSGPALVPLIVVVLFGFAGLPRVSIGRALPEHP
jgi:hypothetical protein